MPLSPDGPADGVSPTSDGVRAERRASASLLPTGQGEPEATPLTSDTETGTSFHIVPGRSAVLVRARSTVGTVAFATSDLTGVILTEPSEGMVEFPTVLDGRLSVPLQTLTSGNVLYDGELRRRIDTRRYPLAQLVLKSATHLENSDRHELVAEMEFHNVVRSISGYVIAERIDASTIVIPRRARFRHPGVQPGGACDSRHADLSRRDGGRRAARGPSRVAGEI